MKISIKETKTYDVKTVLVSAFVRYWEDATVNGLEDTDGQLIPCRVGNCWCPEIEISTGKILNWQQGVPAEIHYKVCDSCNWYLVDDTGYKCVTIENEYVPKFLSPEGNGYGDYIIMNISADGVIQNWDPDSIDDDYEED